MVYINIKELLKEKGKTKYWLIKNMEGSYQSISHMMNECLIKLLQLCYFFGRGKPPHSVLC